MKKVHLGIKFLNEMKNTQRAIFSSTLALGYLTLKETGTFSGSLGFATTLQRVIIFWTSEWLVQVVL